MGCIDELDYEILLAGSTIAECVAYIEKNFKEVYYVHQGYRIFNAYLVGCNPVPVAVEDENVIMPYIKPCQGAFVLKVKGKDEVEKLRTGKDNQYYATLSHLKRAPCI